MLAVVSIVRIPFIYLLELRNNQVIQGLLK